MKRVFWEPYFTVGPEQWALVMGHEWRSIGPRGNVTLLGLMVLSLSGVTS
jgi:hypothetical protein